MSYIRKLCKYTFRAIDSAFITGINKPHCIVWQRLFDTHLLTADNKKADWKDTTAHLNLWAEEDLEYYFNTVVADMRKCKIYVFDSMPNYVEKKLVNQALEMSTRYITSLAIAIGVDLHSK
ncbi:Ulp1-like peptidase [Cucumis melo var. makuwa]|uniref:Ulp1-like peptidase n=1 Tax=Cucumis melo var. makuwa TaxID=1194695 RepID=A0A5A7VK63_CUCMM|nr:Ulp1-like peptidase [Cucumis melo var. makuwa]